MEGLVDYLTDEVQNWEFRIEDILLHSWTGITLAIALRIRKILKKIKSVFKTN